MNMYNYIMTPTSICLTNGVDIFNINSIDEHYTIIKQLILLEEYEKAVQYFNKGAAIESWSGELLDIDDGEVIYNGMALTGKLVDKILGMMKDGDKAFERFANFLDKVMFQDSYKTRNRLMDFVACESVEITDEGDVIAFKNVSENYYDKRSGKFRNMVGDSPFMDRADVDDDHENTCSAGLHVCSVNYLKGFWGISGRTMKVVVDPANFVAIPYDYNDSKARVCCYTVVEDVTDKLDQYL